MELRPYQRDEKLNWSFRSCAPKRPVSLASLHSGRYDPSSDLARHSSLLEQRRRQFPNGNPVGRKSEEISCALMQPVNVRACFLVISTDLRGKSMRFHLVIALVSDLNGTFLLPTNLASEYPLGCIASEEKHDVRAHSLFRCVFEIRQAKGSLDLSGVVIIRNDGHFIELQPQLDCHYRVARFMDCHPQHVVVRHWQSPIQYHERDEQDIETRHITGGAARWN